MIIIYGIIVVLLLMGTINVGTAVTLGIGAWIIWGNGRQYIESLINGFTTREKEEHIGFSDYDIIEKRKNDDNGMKYIGTVRPTGINQTSRNLPTIRR